MFSQNLKQLRKDRHLTQQQLADKLHISQSSLAMYERGLRAPNFDMCILIADFFNVPLDKLIGNMAPGTPPLVMFSGVGGIESSPPSSPENELDRQIIDLFRSLPEQDKMKALGYLQALSDK